MPSSPQIYAALRQDIITLRLRPGRKLSENEIALRFGVSRTPVREAFIKLAEIGLVEVLPQRGTFVQRISLADVLSARFVREAIEVAVVRNACLSADAAFDAELARVIGAQEKIADANDHEPFLALDEEFHHLIASASGETRAWEIVEEEKAQMDRVRFLSLPTGATPTRQIVEQHRAIAGAIAVRDVAAAEDAVRTHLRLLLPALEPLQRQHPELFAGSEDQT